MTQSTTPITTSNPIQNTMQSTPSVTSPSTLPNTVPSIAPTIPWWLAGLVIPVLQLILAFGIASMVVLFVGEDPVRALKVMLYGAFDPSQGLPTTLYISTSLIFTGLAVAVAFHAGLFNIGGEGQAYMAGLGVILACLWLDSSMGPVAMFLFATLAAVVFGSLWAFLPGYLQAKRGAHVVITTIMFNYIAAGLMNYLLVGPLKAAGGLAVESRAIEAGALLPKIHEWLAGFGIVIRTSFFNFSTLLAVLCVLGVWWLLWYTRLGYNLRVLGKNPKAAQYAGLSATKLTIIAMLISGGLAGLMAVNNVYGAQGRLLLGFTGGMGFLGIAVALMGRNHPLGIVAAALLFGALYQGSTDLQFEFSRISPELLLVFQGLVVFFAAALDKLVRSPVERGYMRLASKAAHRSAPVKSTGSL